MNAKANEFTDEQKYELVLSEYRTIEVKNKVLNNDLNPDVNYILNKFFNNDELNLKEYKVVFKFFENMGKEVGNGGSSSLSEKVEEEIVNNPQETLKEIVKDNPIDDDILSWMQSVAKEKRLTDKTIELGICININGEEKDIILLVDMKKLKYEFITVTDIMASLIADNPEFAELINNTKSVNDEIKNDDFVDINRLAIDKYISESRKILTNVATFKGVADSDLDYNSFWSNIDDAIILSIMDKLKELINPNKVDNWKFFQVS